MTMTKPTCSVASTTRLLNTLGRMCLIIMRMSEDPATRARAMKSAERTDSVTPRAHAGVVRPQQQHQHRYHRGEAGP